MYFTRTCMCIMHRKQIMLFKYLIEVADKIRQIIYIYCSIFNYRNCFIITGQITQQSKSCFS